jgi:hypothetical protein
MSFACSMIEDAGLAHLYGDALSAGTAYTAERGRRLGLAVSDPRDIHPGALWIDAPRHGGLIREYLGGGLVATVEGNVNNGIYTRTRSISGVTILSPAGLADGEAPPQGRPGTEWWLEDVRARGKQFILGRYQREAYARNATRILNRRPSTAASWPRVQRSGSAWVVIGGPLRYYGPWRTKAAQQHAKALILPRLREAYGLPAGTMILREFSKEV